MKIGISAKLFLVILVACALVLAVYGVVGRVLFEHSFLGYLNEQGEERMHEVLPRLQAAYREHGDWEFIRGNPEAWFGMMRPAQPNDADIGIPRAPSVSDQTGAVPRLALLDAAGRYLVGNPDARSQAIRLPVAVDGRTVGWLAMVPFQQAIAAGDVRFFHAQMRAWWINGIASVIVAALLAWLLSRAPIRRVRSFTEATHRLAAGDYAIRIDADTSDELGRLARDFNHLAQGLERNEHARREFMADISHELRTPLAVMRAELEAIQDGIRPATPESVGALHQQVGQLGKLVEDLHDLSMTDVGALAYRREPIDLAVVAETALAGMRARFQNAGLHLHADIHGAPLRVEGDEHRLQQLFANLLENALRYTDAGGRVELHCNRGDGGIRIVLDDGAPGVDADKLPRLFERFYRTDASRNRASGGSGLGLAICRNIVEAHNGRIAASASPLGGLRIAIALPEAA